METSIVVLLIVVAVVLIALLGAAIALFVKLLKTGALIRDGLMPIQGKIAFWSAVVYSVSPLDLLPDPIYLDDIGLLIGAITYIGHLARKHGIVGSRSGNPIAGGGTGHPPLMPPPDPTAGSHYR